MNMKKLVSILTVCIWLLPFMGCSTPEPTISQKVESQMVDFNELNFQNKLSLAQSYLQQNKPALALGALSEASRLAEENGYQQVDIAMLRCEAHLKLGETIEAYNQAKELLDVDLHAPINNELMGKCLLKDGKFHEAETHFTAAQQAYTNPVDIDRAKDLVSLARGLIAYEEGNLKLAERYFQAIVDGDLQYAVDTARKDIEAQAR
jgi:tetratricopeptide (TPR) repeat protein